MIKEGNVGICKVRKNIDGVLYSLVYGKACSLCIDPIEKKPLFHFAPGSRTLSIATVGCNFMCRFCLATAGHIQSRLFSMNTSMILQN